MDLATSVFEHVEVHVVKSRFQGEDKGKMDAHGWLEMKATNSQRTGMVKSRVLPATIVEHLHQGLLFQLVPYVLWVLLHTRVGGTRACTNDDTFVKLHGGDLAAHFPLDVVKVKKTTFNGSAAEAVLKRLVSWQQDSWQAQQGEQMVYEVGLVTQAMSPHNQHNLGQFVKVAVQLICTAY